MQILDRGDPEVADPLEQPVQHLHRRLGVGQRAVVGGDLGAEVGGQGAELAVRHLVAEQDLPSQRCGVDDREARPPIVELVAAAAQETDVERRVVGDQDTALGELEESG